MVHMQVTVWDWYKESKVKGFYSSHLFTHKQKEFQIKADLYINGLVLVKWAKNAVYIAIKRI